MTNVHNMESWQNKGTCLHIEQTSEAIRNIRNVQSGGGGGVMGNEDWN